MAEQIVPKHLGLILDGNRRWAKAKGLPLLEGHRQGAEVLKSTVLAAFDRGVLFVSAYVFSAENWQRTEEEVGYLMKLVTKAVTKHLSTFNKAGVRVVILGSRDGLDTSVLRALEVAEQTTANNSRGTLALCFNYGGKQEIVDAVKSMLEQNIPAESVDHKIIESFLYHPEVPPVDLLVRTSGEHRTSGFMLYRADYAELYFTETLWPDFDEAQLDAALSEYGRRQRRFGQ